VGRSIAALVVCLSLVGCGDNGGGMTLGPVDDAVSLYTSAAQPFVVEIARCIAFTTTGRDVSAERCVHAALTEFEALRADATVSTEAALATADGGCRARLNVVKARIGAVARATHTSASYKGHDRRRESSLRMALGSTTGLLDDAVAAAHGAC
jgi:hypothetical protein